MQVTSVLQESQTFDEAAHLAAGYSYWRTGDFRMNPEHPPLGKLLNALPLVFLPLDDVTRYPEWPHPLEEFEFGSRFLYHNRVGADALLFRARLVTVGITLALGLAIALWARSLFGAPAALAATAFYCFDPNITAHGRYVTTDVIAALTVFLSCVSWGRYLRTRTVRDLLIAGVCLGGALVSKFSTVFLLPVLLLLWWFSRGRAGKAWELPALFGVAAVVVAIVYGGETVAVLKGTTNRPRLMDIVDKRHAVGQVLRWGGKHLHLPPHQYLLGLNSVASHNIDGQESYLLGEHAQFGWWYYFPLLFAVKTPLAVWIAMLLGVVLLWRAPWGSVPLEWMVIAIPPLVYFAMSLTSQLNLGIRHILPVYPFLYVALGFVLERFARFAPFVLLLALVEWAWIYPTYLPYFNWAAGGPANGIQYAVDSNLDWGQDAKRLKAYMSARPQEKFCIEYFGMAELKYYGLPDPYIPKTADKEGRANMDCYAAISATLLEDLYIPKGSYEWLRERDPVARIGYSIYVFDVRKKGSAGTP